MKIALKISLSRDSLFDIVQKSCNISLPNVSDFLGSGKQGEVYDMGDRVMKIQVAPDEEEAKSRVREIRNLRRLNIDIYPKISDAKVLCEVENPGVGLPHGVAYYYIMEKLEKAPNTSEISKMFNDSIRGRKVDEKSPLFPTVKSLIERMDESGTNHVDVNPGNIMQDKDGNIKLIDMDSVIVSGKFSHPLGNKKNEKGSVFGYGWSPEQGW